MAFHFHQASSCRFYFHCNRYSKFTRLWYKDKYCAKPIIRSIVSLMMQQSQIFYGELKNKGKIKAIPRPPGTFYLTSYLKRKDISDLRHPFFIILFAEEALEPTHHKV